MPFETFGFATNYAVELNPEQPGAGWGDAQRVFVRPGTNEDVIAAVTPNGRHAWLAVDGYFMGASPWVCATPNPNLICFGAGWSEVGGQLVDVVQAEPVHQLDLYMPNACGFPELGLLLLVSFTDITAIGVDGVAWESDRLALDDLSIVSASKDGIVCEGYFGGERPSRFTIDPATGKQISGPVFRDPLARREPWRPFRRARRS